MAVDRIRHNPAKENDYHSVQVPLALRRTNTDPSIAPLSELNRISTETRLSNAEDPKRMLDEKQKRVAALRKLCTDPNISAEQAREALSMLFQEELPDIDLDTPFELPTGAQHTRRAIAETVFAERIPLHHEMVSTLKDSETATEMKRTAIKRKLVAMGIHKERTDDTYAPPRLALPERGPTVRVLGFVDSVIANSPHIKGAKQLAPEALFTHLTARTGTKAVR